jgi:hypothetical protein
VLLATHSQPIQPDARHGMIAQRVNIQCRGDCPNKHLLHLPLLLLLLFLPLIDYTYRSKIK